jgi:hypothetical protein
MRILDTLRFVGGSVARANLRRAAHKMLAATEDCRQAQQNVLQRLISLNADSQFGREHRLGDVRTPADLRNRLPVSDFEAYRPYIDKMKLGDHGALLGPNNRLLMFSLSSGTTAESKYIPITEQFLADYRRGWQSWGIMAFDHHYSVHWRKIVQLTSDYDRYRTPDGTPCGNISGLVVAMQRKVVRLMYSVPKVIAKIEDPEAKYYASLRLAVADSNVGIMTTANPSTLLHLARMADREKEELIRDIANGTLSRRFDIPASIRAKLRFSIGIKRKRRARLLDQLVERTGHLWPRDYWPGMEILAVWSGGSAGAYLPSVRKLYGDVPVRDHGLHASEGRMTIPLEANTSAGVLEADTHFFEFIPEAEYGSDDPIVLEAHELEEGCNYFILMTTSSGLYRYDIQDVVRCVGFRHSAPILEFLHKGAHISNITGEKISESQVVDAVRQCAQESNTLLSDFTLAPVWGEPPGYQLLTESPAGKNLARRVDAKLQEINCEYREKRQTGRLVEMKSVHLPQGTWERFARQRIQKNGGSLEQYKHPCLVPDMDFVARVLSECCAEPVEANVIGTAPRPYVQFCSGQQKNVKNKARKARRNRQRIAD